MKPAARFNAIGADLDNLRPDSLMNATLLVALCNRRKGHDAGVVHDRVRTLLEKAMMRPPEVTLFAACANTRNVPRSFVLMALSNTFLAGPDGGWVNSQVLRANGGFAY